MTRNEKDTINRRTENRHLFQRMKRGLESVRDTPHKRVLLAAYLIGAVLVWLFRAYLFGLDTYGMFSPVLEAVINLLLPLYAVGGLLAVLVLLGTPWGGKAAREGLQKVGLVNHAGEAPPLIAKRQDTDNPRLTVWEFDPCGIPLGEWEDKRARIETALNITIAKMTWAEGRKIIRVYSAPAESDFPDLLPWKDKYLSPDNFVLVLGDGQPYEYPPYPAGRLHRERQERPVKAPAYAGTPQGGGGLHSRFQGRRGLPQSLAAEMPHVFPRRYLTLCPGPACGGAGSPQEVV